MPSRLRLPSGASKAVQRVNWAYLLETGRWIYHHGRRSWERLPQRDRQRLVQILRTSRGRPQNLSASDRSDLRRIVLAALGF